MKLSCILSLVVGSAACGILTSTSAANALTYNWSYDGLANTNGTFDESSGTITSWVGQVGGATITQLLAAGTYPADLGNDNMYPLTAFGVSFQDNNGTSWNLFYNTTNYKMKNSSSPNIDSGNFVASVAVPFDMPGGASIPTVGSLLALGAIRKARKSIASKTRIAELVVTLKG